MTTLTCPKCRQGLTDDALDVGQCPLCGFPLDGPVVLGAAGTRGSGTRLLRRAGLVARARGAGSRGMCSWASRRWTRIAKLRTATGLENRANWRPPLSYVAPFPHEPKRIAEEPPDESAKMPPAAVPGMGDKGADRRAAAARGRTAEAGRPAAGCRGDEGRTQRSSRSGISTTRTTPRGFLTSTLGIA